MLLREFVLKPGTAYRYIYTPTKLLYTGDTTAIFSGAISWLFGVIVILVVFHRYFGYFPTGFWPERPIVFVVFGFFAIWWLNQNSVKLWNLTQKGNSVLFYLGISGNWWFGIIPNSNLFF